MYVVGMCFNCIATKRIQKYHQKNKFNEASEMNSEIVLSSWRYLLPFYALLRFTLITLSRVLRQYLRRDLRDAFLVHNILVERNNKHHNFI